MTKNICIKNCKFMEFTQFYNIEFFLQHDHFVMVKLGMLPKSRIIISCMCNYITLSDFFLQESISLFKLNFFKINCSVFLGFFFFCMHNLQLDSFEFLIYLLIGTLVILKSSKKKIVTILKLCHHFNF